MPLGSRGLIPASKVASLSSLKHKKEWESGNNPQDKCCLAPALKAQGTCQPRCAAPAGGEAVLVSLRLQEGVGVDQEILPRPSPSCLFLQPVPLGQSK